MNLTLTQQQKAIINAKGSIKINAVAGSGKTFTIIEYAKAKPRSSKMLYLVFNKSVKDDAIAKFAKSGLHNVNVETAHSLAFRHIVRGSNYKLNAIGYKTPEIVEILQLKGDGKKHSEYIIANHINRLVAFFCNSRKRKIRELDYLSTITDLKVKSFVSHNYHYIEHQARVLMSKMNSGEIAITHDFYLKKFQLASPALDYDYILFDEGQDASMAMLDVFLKQKATKVIVGDTHQQIYSWRYAVNSLEKTDFKTYLLSNSFRFAQDIASLAQLVLKMKRYIDVPTNISIAGAGGSNSTKTKAVLARTNLGLLLKAIEYVTEKQEVKHIHFEGNINSYTYAADGASLYDVLNLDNGKGFMIKDELIKTMTGLDDLDDYIEKTGDRELSMMVEIVKEYGNEIPRIIKKIKEKHVDNKDEAEMIFSTVHRSKGMEYDVVELVGDFVSEDYLMKLEKSNQKDDVDKSQLNEEINLLYVAITRARNILYIPELLVPKGFSYSPKIRIIKEDADNVRFAKGRQPKKEKSSKPDAMSRKKRQAYAPWTDQLDHELRVMHKKGVTPIRLARHFGRTRGAIIARLEKLGLYV